MSRHNNWVGEDVPADPNSPRAIAPGSCLDCGRGSLSGVGGAASSVAQTTGAGFCLFCLPLFLAVDESVVSSTGSVSLVRFLVCLGRTTAALRSARSSTTWQNESSALMPHSQPNPAFRSPGADNEKKKLDVGEGGAREGMGHKGRSRSGY